MRTRVGVIGAALLTLVGAAPAQASLDPGSEFYAPPPNAEALRQIDRLRSNGQAGAARKLEAMVHVPGSVWFVDGTPADVREYAQETVAAASSADVVPVLVPYNVPGRDCGSYSAGGAANGNAYKAWIDALVEGIGQAEAVVVIEPDGLPRLPQDCGLPDTYNRVALINYAVHAFLADANAHFYVDAGPQRLEHSGSHGLTPR